MLVRDLEQVKHDPVQEVDSRRTPPNRQTSPMCAGVATKPADPLKADLSPAGLDAQTTCSAPDARRSHGFGRPWQAGVDSTRRLPGRDPQSAAFAYRPGATSAVSRRAPTTWGALGQFGLPPGSAAGSGSRLGLNPLEAGKLTGGQVGPAVPAAASGREGGGGHSKACHPERAAHSDQHRGDGEQLPRTVL
jgi:hypothetical protein